MGLPEILYTDGLSLFGPSSLGDRADPKSEFQRALRGLGVAHLVAPTPQAKGKIERRFRTFQGRLVTLLAHAGAVDAARAGEVLAMEIDRLNRTRSRATGSVAGEVWERQSLDGTGRMRPSRVPACSTRTSPCAARAGSTATTPSTSRGTTTRSRTPRAGSWVSSTTPEAGSGWSNTHQRMSGPLFSGTSHYETLSSFESSPT